MRWNGWADNEKAGDDISSCKMKRETVMISAMGRIKARRRQGGKMDGAGVEGRKGASGGERRDE